MREIGHAKSVCMEGRSGLEENNGDHTACKSYERPSKKEAISSTRFLVRADVHRMDRGAIPHLVLVTWCIVCDVGRLVDVLSTFQVLTAGSPQSRLNINMNLSPTPKACDSSSSPSHPTAA